MITVVQEAGSIPLTLHEWEQTLTRALLQANGGNTDTVRSFEITPETLASYCGLGADYAAAAEDAFRRALRANILLLNKSLKHGRLKAGNKNVPNCMAMLALSLLVDSLLDGDYQEIGQYRAKLANWLGVDRRYSDLRGLQAMWEELVAWLDDRIADGDAFRRVALPDSPPRWTHVGYTRYLSFPNKRDLRYLTKRLANNPRLASDPATLVRLLEPDVGSALVSPGLKAAFGEFKAALRSGAASVDHRFWKLISAALPHSGRSAASSCRLVMNHDEDGERTYFLSVADEVRGSVPALGLAAMSPELQDSPNLGPSIRRGILFFRSSGLASWTAAGEPFPGNGPFHVALAERHVHRASGAIARFEKSGTWRVTVEPVPAYTVSDILQRIGIRNSKETVRTIGLVDGVRVGRSWLGLPRYLPHIEGADGVVVIRGLGKPAATGLSWNDGKLSAASPIKGEFSISDESEHWSRRAMFVPLAEPHAELDGAGFSHSIQREWQSAAVASVKARVPEIELYWNESPYEHQDVIEAIYASARAGIGEGEIVDLVGRGMGNRSWDMLRSLQEATVVDARLRPRWRGRTFTLGKPTVCSVQIGTRAGVVVSGAMPTKLERDFHDTVKLQGGSPFRRFGGELLLPPVIGAVDIDPEAIAKALGWSHETHHVELDGTAATRLLQTKVRGEGYLTASTWDWRSRRFRVGSAPRGEVTLIRLVHPDGRDHDLYRVTGKEERTFLSRHSAIVDAFLQAGLPLFRKDGESVRRLAAEGAFPLELAKALRLRTLTNSGIYQDGWGYAVSAFEASWLAQLLPGLIDGLRTEPMNDAAMSYRRGRGARRALWIEGGLVA